MAPYTWADANRHSQTGGRLFVIWWSWPFIGKNKQLGQQNSRGLSESSSWSVAGWALIFCDSCCAVRCGSARLRSHFAHALLQHFVVAAAPAMQTLIVYEQRRERCHTHKDARHMVEITPRRLQLKLKKRDLKGRCYQDGCSQNQFARLFTSILATQQQQLPSGCCSCTYCMWEKHCYMLQ